MSKGLKKQKPAVEVHSLADRKPESQTIEEVKACWRAHPNWSGRQVCDELQIGYSLLWSWSRLDEDFREFYWEHSRKDRDFDEERSHKTKEEVMAIRQNACLIWEDNEFLSVAEVADMVGCNVGLLYSWVHRGVDKEFIRVYKNAMQARLILIKSRVEQDFRDGTNKLSGLHVGMASMLLGRYDPDARSSKTLELPEGTKSASITFEGTEKPADGGT